MKMIKNKNIIGLIALFLASVFSCNILSASLPNTITINVPQPKAYKKNSSLMTKTVTMKLEKYSIRDRSYFKIFRDHQKYTQAGDPKGADLRNFEEITILTALSLNSVLYFGFVFLLI